MGHECWVFADLPPDPADIPSAAADVPSAPANIPSDPADVQSTPAPTPHSEFTGLVLVLTGQVTLPNFGWW